MMSGVRGSSWLYEDLFHPEGRVSPSEMSIFVIAAGMEVAVEERSLSGSAVGIAVVVAVHAAPCRI